MKKKLLLIIPILALLLFSINYVFGAGSETTVKVSNPLPWKTFIEFIYKIIEAIVKVALILAPLMLIIAGFLMTTSGGPITGNQQDQIKKAKGIIVYTVVGLLILFGAWGFTYWIYKHFGITK